MAALDFVDKYEERQFYRWLGKVCEKYFEDPENKKRFEEWKKECELNVDQSKTEYPGQAETL